MLCMLFNHKDVTTFSPADSMCVLNHCVALYTEVTDNQPVVVKATCWVASLPFVSKATRAVHRRNLHVSWTPSELFLLIRKISRGFSGYVCVGFGCGAFGIRVAIWVSVGLALTLERRPNQAS